MKDFNITAFGKKDLGVRKSRDSNGKGHNDDSILVDPGIGLYCVADGVSDGGYGYVASQIVVSSIKSHVDAFIKGKTGSDPVKMLVAAIVDASARVTFEGSNPPEGVDKEGYKRMSTTLVSIFIYKSTAYIAYVGDSRAYLYSGGGFVRITEDHSRLNELIAQGTPRDQAYAELEAIGYLHAISRAIGCDTFAQPDIYTRDISNGDVFLLCSDGLYGEVDHNGLASLIDSSDLQGSVDNLIKAANDHGGRDNISAVLINVSDTVSDTLPDNRWFVRTTEKKLMGPFTLDALKSNLHSNKLSRLDEVILNINEDWIRISTIKELKDTTPDDSLFEKDTVLREARVEIKPEQPEEKTEIKITNSIPIQPPDLNTMPEEGVFITPAPKEKRGISRSKRPYIVLGSIAVAVLLLVWGVLKLSRSDDETEFLEKSTELSTAVKSENMAFNNYYIQGKNFEDAALYENAYNMYKKALEIKSSDFRTKLRKASLEIQIFNKLELAEPVMSELEKNVEDNKISNKDLQSAILNMIGIFNYKKDEEDNYNKADGYFKRIGYSGNIASQALYNRGRIFFDRQEYKTALQYFTDSQKEKEILNAGVYKGITLMKLKKYGECADVFNSLVEKQHNRREPYTYGAFCYYMAKKKNEAESLINNLILVDPYYYKSSSQDLNEIFVEQNIDEEYNLLKSMEGVKNTMYVLDILDFLGDKKEEAYSVLSGLNNLLSLTLLGNLKLLDNKNTEASDIATKITEKFPKQDNPGTNLFLGKIRFYEDNYQRAEEYFEKAKAKMPTEQLSIEALLFQGDIDYINSNSEQALSKWNKIVSIDNTYIPVKQRMIKMKKGILK